MAAQGGTRAATPPVQLIPISGSRCAVLCPARAGAKLVRLTAADGRAQEIDRQRIIRKRRVLWLLYLEIDGIRLGAEVGLEFADATGRPTVQRARLVLGAWSEDLAAAVWQMARRLAGTPGLAPDHGGLIRFLALVSAWGLRCERIVAGEGLHLAWASGAAPAAPLRHGQCLAARDGRLSLEAAAATPVGPQQLAFVIGGAPADAIFFAVEDRLIQLDTEQAALGGASGIAAWLGTVTPAALQDLAGLFDEAARGAGLPAAAGLLRDLPLPPRARLRAAGGAVEIDACAAGRDGVVVFGRVSGTAPATLVLTARTPGGADAALDWRARTHVDPRDAGDATAPQSPTVRFAAVLRDRLPSPAIRIEAATGSSRDHVWVPVQAGGDRTAETWRPAALLDDGFVRSIVRPLRAMPASEPALVGEARYGAADGARGERPAEGLSVIVLTDGDAEALHRTIVALLLSLGGADEAIVALSQPVASAAVGDLLGRCAGAYGIPLILRTVAAPCGELQLVHAVAACAGRDGVAVLRGGDVPGHPGWLRGAARSLQQQPRAILLDRLPAAEDALADAALWPRSVAIPPASLDLLDRVDPALRTLEAGLADLAWRAAAEQAVVLASGDLAMRRASLAAPSEAADVARRIDGCLLAERGWESGVVDLERVRRAGARVRR